MRTDFLAETDFYTVSFMIMGCMCQYKKKGQISLHIV